MRNRPRAQPAAFVLLAALAPMPSFADESCRQDQKDATPPTINVRIDNDTFASGEQDQGYTNGAVFTFVSPDLTDYTDDPCLPNLARWINSWMVGMPGPSPDQKNMVFSLSHLIYTPTDWTRSDIIQSDRPYAAILMASAGYNLRRGNTLETTQIQLGLVGPAALGEEVQDAVHNAIGADLFSGWRHQLRNEPLFGFVHERMQKYDPPSTNYVFDDRFDVITHWGGSIGNAFTHANAGAEIRFGPNLPDDFGSTPTRPAGENTAPGGFGRAQGFSWHVFASTDLKWVVRDITLDGNTFQSSHSVDKRPLVAEGGVGLVINYDDWKIAFARYWRTREFETQDESPRFGSFTISRSF